jgi:hypothetical protein
MQICHSSFTWQVLLTAGLRFAGSQQQSRYPVGVVKNAFAGVVVGVKKAILALLLQARAACW